MEKIITNFKSKDKKVHEIYSKENPTNAHYLSKTEIIKSFLKTFKLYKIDKAKENKKKCAYEDYSDMLKEREYQNEIKKRKQEMNNIIEKQFFDMEKKRKEEMEKKEKEKIRIEEEKKRQTMNIMNDQLKEYKIKIIQDYQEKQVEGQIMKLRMKKALEDEQKEKKILEQKKTRTKKRIHRIQ